MYAYDVVLITEDRYEAPAHIDGYIANILADDAIVTKALETHGLRVIRRSWSNPDFNWSSARCAIFRTTWDYFHRFDEFKQWMKATSLQTRFINSLEIIQWNMDKHYLADLKANGVNIVASTFMERGSDVNLRELLHLHQVNKGIIKPTVSGTARHTYIVEESNLHETQSMLNDLLQQESMLFQPFQRNILHAGELSLVLINGTCTHAVRKTAKQGDFRVQDDFGGTVHEHSPTPEEVSFAESALAACRELPVYARVDMIRDNHDNLAIMELELIEPELWFRKNPEAAVPFARSIYQLLS
jgi:glutathione synthase/RimK-type ligase-like ATP-grasp enzyme